MSDETTIPVSSCSCYCHAGKDAPCKWCAAFHPDGDK